MDKKSNKDHTPEDNTAEAMTSDEPADENSEAAAADAETVPETEETAGTTTETTGEETAEKTPKPPKKKLTDKINKFIEKTGLVEMALLRFITVFFFGSAMNVSAMREDNVLAVPNWREFVEGVDMLMPVILMASAFIMLSAIYYVMPKRYQIVDQSFAIASILYFDFTLLWRANDFNLSVGVALVSCVFIYYALGKLKSKKLYNSIPWWVCALFVLAAAVTVGAFVGVTTVCRHRNFGTACHDFGLFVQMYHSLITDGTAVTTCERDEFMSHFKIHASYIFYTLVPFFKMFPKPETLLIAQSVLAMGGVVPLFLIAKRHDIKGVSLIFICLAYVFSSGIVAPCYYEFHENAFLPTLIMWLFWAVDRKNYPMFYVMSVLVCIVKEDAPLYVVCIAMYMFFENKGDRRRLHGIIVSALAMSYMIIITNWLTENGDGQMMMGTRFGILMIDQEGGLKEVVKNVLIDPSYFFSLLLHDDTRIFFFQTMLPLLFLPFFTKKIHRYLLMIPFIIMNLVIGAGYGYAASVSYQYIFGPVCLLIFMALINLDDMGQRAKQELPMLLGTAAAVITFGTFSHNIFYYINNKADDGYLAELDIALDAIPKDGNIGADVFMIPHLADHKEVYIFDGNDINEEEGTVLTPERFDFVVIPMMTDVFEHWSTILESNGYVTYDQVRDRYRFYMSPSYAERTGTQPVYSAY